MSASLPASAEVFISYASADRSRVLPVADQLRQAGAFAWFDRSRIEGGMRWAEEIVRGIQSAKALLLMCSDAAMRSRAVRQEIQLAWRYELAYLPLLLERTDFPEQLQFFLEGCQWVEVLDYPPPQWLPPVLRALEHAGVACPANRPGVNEAPDAEVTRPGPTLAGLRALAKFTDRIWPLVVERRDGPDLTLYEVHDLGAAREGACHKIRLGSQVCLAINADWEAHLLLLDEGPEGKTYCLCPSWFAPDTRLHAGINILPQAEAGCEPFVITGIPGREQLLAILTDEPLGLGWMPPDTRVPARVLTNEDIEQLLTTLRQLKPGTWSALATYCDVVG